MPSIDQFESVFRASERTPYRHEKLVFERLVVVTDLSAEDGAALVDDVRRFTAVLDGVTEIVGLHEPDWTGVDDLLEKTTAARADLIVTYRNLRDGSWHWPYSLGAYLNVLTQRTDVPVLLIPHPGEQQPIGDGRTDNVVVVADHLAGDHRLVNAAVAMAHSGGTLWLTHVEDDAVFERYMSVIARIPSIDTDEARELILERLLSEPRDYIESVATTLRFARVPLRVEPVVGLGHRVADYRRLIEDHAVDLIVFHTKDDGQLAMHGVAYSLAVELRSTPMLML